jgi:hypothetical protein
VGRGGGGVPVGFRASGESIVIISFGERKRGVAWRVSQAAVL